MRYLVCNTTPEGLKKLDPNAHVVAFASLGIVVGCMVCAAGYAKYRTFQLARCAVTFSGVRGWR